MKRLASTSKIILFFIQLLVASFVAAAPLPSGIEFLESINDGGTDSYGNSVTGLNGATSVIFSHDGKYLYLGSFIEDTISVFEVNTTNHNLKLVQVLVDDVNGIDGLNDVYSLSISPDDKHLYALSKGDKAMAVYSRDAATGMLSTVEVLTRYQTDSYGNVITGFGSTLTLGLNDITISQDGNFVYASNTGFFGGAIFKRDSVTGRLEWKDLLYPFHTGDSDLDISADDSNLYLLNRQDEKISTYSRDAITGAITKVGEIVDTTNLRWPRDLISSKDGKHVYVVGRDSDTLVTYSRDGMNSGLLAHQAVLTEGALDTNGVTVSGLNGAQGIAINPDETRVYVTSATDYVTVFNRNTSTGLLTFDGTIFNGDMINGKTVSGLNRPENVTISPDGAYMVVASYISDSIALFELTQPSISHFTVSPSALLEGNTAVLSWDILNADTVTIEPAIGTVANTGAFSVSPTITTTYTISAQNANGTITQEVTLTVEQDADGDGIGNNVDPDDDNDQIPDDYEIANELNPLDATDAIGDLDGDGLSNLDEYLAGTEINNPDTDGDTYNDSQDFFPLDPNQWESPGTIFTPPEPSDIAPVIDPGIVGFADEIAFLYSSSTPVQVEADPLAFDEKRMAVIRGRALSADGLALSGVKITILNHPEYGYTMTRADGMFDMAVNGGHLYAVNYQKSGYPVIQRSVKADWNDYHTVDDVMLITYDTQSTLVQTGAASFQVAQSSETIDADGTRKTTVFFPPQTQASLVMPNGDVISASQLTIRATEYTVGETGPQRMPGDLPATSGYTFAVELSADEAVAAGAKSVVFSQAVPVYVDNFIQFPAGVVVPSGWYDADKAAWIPSKNGRVIDVIAIADNQAVLDVMGSGQAATTQELLGLGISSDELATIASTYAAGASLWRVPVTHFTPWDYNWPVVPPPGAGAPKEEHDDEEPVNKSLKICGSIIECENQTLGERVDVVGTNLSLNYRSDRVRGRLANRSLRVNLTGGTIPSSLQQVIMVVEVAGQKITKNFPPLADQSYDFVWDGLDAYGRTVTGEYTAKVQVGYVYEGQYAASRDDFNQAFSQFSTNAFISGNRSSNIITVWSRATTLLSSYDARSEYSLGGWSLSAHHRYHPSANKIHKGDGSKHFATTLNNIVKTIAGNGTWNNYQVSGPALEIGLQEGIGVASAPDGTIYFWLVTGRVYKLTPDGLVESFYYNHNVWGMDVDGEGNLYLAINADNNARIEKITPEGELSIVAGGGTISSGEGIAALDAKFTYLWDVAVADDGAIYFLTTRGKLQKISTDGRLTTIAGDGVAGYSGDDGPAIDARINSESLDIGPNGVIYIADYSNRVRTVSADGIIRTIAGNGERGAIGENVPALNASVGFPSSIEVGRDGTIYVASEERYIRKISPAGIITTLAGNGDQAFNGENSGLYAALNLRALCLDNDENIIFLDSYSALLRQIGPAFPSVGENQQVIASEDGGKIYIFDANGRHLETRNAITNQKLLTFSYTDDQLSSITDANANVTNIVRYGATGFDIVAPFGQTTQVRYDGNGYISTISNPADETHTATHDAYGLLRGFDLPNGLISTIDYDEKGRLIFDENSEGNSWSLSKDITTHQYQVTMSSALGRTATHLIKDLGDGATQRIRTLPNGTTNTSTSLSDGGFIRSSANGTNTTGNLIPDPRFGMQAPITGLSDTVLPSGLTHSVAHTRELLPAGWVLRDGLGAIETITDTKTINGLAFTTSFDVLTNLQTIETPLGRTQEMLFDNIGRPLEVRVPGLETVYYSYDANGRLASAVQGTGANRRSETYGYESGTGFLASITNEDATWVGFSGYDLAGRAHTQSFSDGRTVGYDFNSVGNVTGIQPPGKPFYDYVYTGTSLLADDFLPALGPLNRQTHYAYDLDKNLSRIDRIDGSSIHYGYHIDTGQLQTISWDTLVFNRTYDPATGQLASASSPYGVDLLFDYDGFLQTQEQWLGAVTGTVNFHYNDLFQLSGMDINGATLIEYGYDDDALLSSAGSLMFTLDPNNGLLRNTSQLNVSTTLDYNTFAEVDLYTAQYGVNTLYSYQITGRDTKGRITDITETIQGSSTDKHYDYDGADWLWRVYENGVLSREYGFDLNGNRTHVNGTLIGVYDDRDRLNSYDGNTYSYYDTGELATKTQGPSVTRYSHDAFNNLTQVELPDGTLVSYLADSKGRRVSKSVGGVKVQGFLYQDKLNPVAELDGASNIVARFVYGTKGHVPDFMLKDGQTYRLISDHLGSVRLVINSSTGTVAQRLDYDEYGNVLNDSNPGFQPFAYAGGFYDVDTGLVRFGARDYDAAVGRWIQSDPIGFQGGLDTYAYVGNNPVVYIDPWGLIQVKPGANTSNISPNISKHYPAIDSAVSNNSSHNEAVITSGNDSRHKQNSKHYSDEAIDVRGNNVTDQQMKDIADEIQKNLGPDYDVIPEYFPENPLNDHIHIEYDPKPKICP